MYITGLMESLYMQHTDVHWCIVTPFLVNTNLFKGTALLFNKRFQCNGVVTIIITIVIIVVITIVITIVIGTPWY